MSGGGLGLPRVQSEGDGKRTGKWGGFLVDGWALVPSVVAMKAYPEAVLTVNRYHAVTAPGRPGKESSSDTGVGCSCEGTFEMRRGASVCLPRCSPLEADLALASKPQAS